MSCAHLPVDRLGIWGLRGPWFPAPPHGPGFLRSPADCKSLAQPPPSWSSRGLPNQPPPGGWPASPRPRAPVPAAAELHAPIVASARPWHADPPERGPTAQREVPKVTRARREPLPSLPSGFPETPPAAPPVPSERVRGDAPRLQPPAPRRARRCPALGRRAGAQFPHRAPAP